MSPWQEPRATITSVIAYVLADEEAGAASQTTKGQVRAIVRDRMLRLFGDVAGRLERSNVARYAKRIVLTGGASQQAGLGELAADFFARPVRIARIQPVGVCRPALPVRRSLRPSASSRSPSTPPRARTGSGADWRQAVTCGVWDSGSARAFEGLRNMRPRIAVIGVGGAGGNAVNNMIAAGLTGAEFMVANTDAQALEASSAEKRIQLGPSLTEGLGAGSKPEIGEAAAEEAIEDIRAAIAGCHMVFIAAGMGGGTGTGAASVIARVAKEFGILTVAVVTKPFQFEGSRRMRVAEAGIAELRKHVDTLLVIPNQNLFRIATDRTTFAEAFVLADQVLYSGIACIVDLIVKEGLINLDLADVKTVLSGMGTAMMGTGEASGEQRAIVASEEAIVNPLLDDIIAQGRQEPAALDHRRSRSDAVGGGRGGQPRAPGGRSRRQHHRRRHLRRGAGRQGARLDRGLRACRARSTSRSRRPQRTTSGRRELPPPPRPWRRPDDYRLRLSEAIDDVNGQRGAGADDRRARKPGVRRADVYITEGPPQLSPLGHATRGRIALGAPRSSRSSRGGRERVLPPWMISHRTPSVSIGPRQARALSAARHRSRRSCISGNPKRQRPRPACCVA